MVRTIDLLAGTRLAAPALRVPAVTQAPARILVFDSGLGGLTVFRELRRALPSAAFVYAADDAVFPYGRLPEDVLVARVVAVMDRLVATHRPDLVVIACNTASTLVLPALRARFAMPFVGTVPAIKPAAALTRTGRVSVLATPGTVARDYTRALVERYAAGVAVTLVGAPGLAALAEAALRGDPVSDAAVAREAGPCFVDLDGRRTDVVVLACTHFPLLLDALARIAPWPVTWLDPAAAIARRAAALAGAPPLPRAAGEATAVFTAGRDIGAPLKAALAGFGLATIAIEAVPPALH